MKALQARLDEIKGTDAQVRVGVFAGGPGRSQVAPYQPGIQALFEAAGLAKPMQDVTNVDLGVWHEFGVPQLNIPERSWLRSAFDGKHDRWEKFAEKQAQLLIDGKVTLEEALGRLGLLAEADVKKGITSGGGIPPPNAPSTVARKGSSRPLVDTGQFLNSVTFEVRSGNDED